MFTLYTKKKKKNLLITMLSVIKMVLDIVIQCIAEVLSALQMGLLNRIWKHINILYPTDYFIVFLKL